MSSKRTTGSRLRRWFLSGLLVVVPLVVTYLVLRFLFTSIDGILEPAIFAIYHKHLPGVGIVVTLLLVLLAGMIAAGVAGRRLVRFWEDQLSRIPLIRMVYGGAKQVMESVSNQDHSAFSQVALVEYPRAGCHSVCFVAHPVAITKNGVSEPYVEVFIPTTPTPFTGHLVLVRPADVTLIDMSLEEAVKLIVSGGIVSPTQFVTRLPQAG